MISTDSGIYRFLVWAAVASVVLVIGSMLYQYVFVGDVPGELNYRRGNLRLEDGEYAKALTEFNLQLGLNPRSAVGFLGKGLALMGMSEFARALEAINTALAIEPKFPAAYANRGILHDRLGKHPEALADYRRALELDEEMGDGAHWLTRFMRNQPEPPPTFVDRAWYLEAQLKKPPSERLLQLPEVDAKQRSYKFEGRL